MTRFAKEKFSSPYIGELVFELATCYQGKSMVIEELMWLRNLDNKPIDFKKHNRKLHFDTWIKEPYYNEEVNHFCESTATELAKIDGADKAKVLADFKLAVDAYLDYCTKRHLEVAGASFKNQIMHFIPEQLKMQMQIARISLMWKPIMESATITQKDGVAVDMKQLKEIVEFMGAGTIQNFEKEHVVNYCNSCSVRVVCNHRHQINPSCDCLIQML